MNLREALQNLEQSRFSKRGGKAYRRLQINRLRKFVSFAERRGTYFPNQVGPQTFACFFEARKTGEKTRTAYLQAWRVLLRLNGLTSTPNASTGVYTGDVSLPRDEVRTQAVGASGSLE